MRGIVVDASVAAKWVVPEEFSDKAALVKGNVLCAPAHWQGEAVNVIWSKFCRGELSPTDAAKRARALMQAPVESVALPLLMDAAVKQSLAYRITIYDSLYISLALARRIRFVTADRKLIQKLSGDRNLSSLVCWVGDLEP